MHRDGFLRFKAATIRKRSYTRRRQGWDEAEIDATTMRVSGQSLESIDNDDMTAKYLKGVSSPCLFQNSTSFGFQSSHMTILKSKPHERSASFQARGQCLFSPSSIPHTAQLPYELTNEATRTYLLRLDHSAQQSTAEAISPRSYVDSSFVNLSPAALCGIHVASCNLGSLSAIKREKTRS